MGDLSKILDFAGQEALPLIFWFCIFFLNSKYYFHLLRIPTNFQTKRRKSVCLVFGGLCNYDFRTQLLCWVLLCQHLTGNLLELFPGLSKSRLEISDWQFAIWNRKQTLKLRDLRWRWKSVPKDSKVHLLIPQCTYFTTYCHISVWRGASAKGQRPFPLLSRKMANGRFFFNPQPPPQKTAIAKWENFLLGLVNCSSVTEESTGTSKRKWPGIRVMKLKRKQFLNIPSAR